VKSRAKAERDVCKAIGAVIRRRRESLELRQKDCAQLAGMSNHALCQIELGYLPMTISQLLALAPVVKMSPASVIDEAVMPIMGRRVYLREQEASRRRLTDADMERILARPWRRGSCVALAEELGVSHALVSLIRRGKYKRPPERKQLRLRLVATEAIFTGVPSAAK
jgi:transcriptional regulator with XRE-family HTH domain